MGINTQKSVIFLYTVSEESKNKVKETIPFTVAYRRIKYVGISLTKEVQNLYTENYKILNEIKEDLNNWNGIPCSWFERQY